jgi:GAF domain-containing protein
MVAAPLPFNEDRRIDALRRLEILDTPPEGLYDDIVEIASFVCDMPISLITFIDSERQWIKASHGIGIKETSRDVAFCAHTILETGPMIIPDAQMDQRFASNPYVLSEPNIRFYAGFPLTAQTGEALGSLCVLDTKPRELSGKQMSTLRALSRQVMALLRLHESNQEIRKLISELNILQGILPICANCKKIRDEAGKWQPVESYVRNRSMAEFSHGLCQDCVKMYT